MESGNRKSGEYVLMTLPFDAGDLFDKEGLI